MKENIVITDVGPRDGLQNQPKTLSIEQRVELIRAIAAAGVPQIEVGSFVSPKAVPAMAGTDRVFAALDAQPDFKTPSIALIPNLKFKLIACLACFRVPVKQWKIPYRSFPF